MTLPTYARHLRDLARAATPGKWEAETWCSDFESSGRWASIGPIHVQSDEEDELDPSSPAALRSERDAAFLSASREGVERLCDDLEAAIEALEKYAESMRDTSAARDCLAKIRGKDET